MIGLANFLSPFIQPTPCLPNPLPFRPRVWPRRAITKHIIYSPNSRNARSWLAGEPAALGTIKPSRGPCLRTTNRIQCGHAFANIRKFFRGPFFQPPGKPRGVFSCSNCFASDLYPSKILFRRRLREVGSVFDRIMRTCIYIYGINAIS